MYKSIEAIRAELPSLQPTLPLSQGDILDACPLVFSGDDTREVAAGDKSQSVEARVIILTQACDLANEKSVRALVAVVHNAAALVQTGRVEEEFIRDNVRRGQVYGWYFLPAHSCANDSRSAWSTSGTFIRCRGHYWKDFETKASWSAG